MCPWRDVDEDIDNFDSLSEDDSELDHFDTTYSLKAKEKYEVNEYQYETDRHGRISHCEGRLRLESGKTNPVHQQKVGGEDRLDIDDGGHLIARRFGGSEKVDNIVPMNYHLNRGEYKAMETEWAKLVAEGKTVDVEIECKYGWTSSERPKVIRVRYIVSDESGEIERRSKSFVNSKEG